MKLKLNNSEMLAMVSLLKATCEAYATDCRLNPADMEYKRDKALFEEMYVKFQERCFRVKKKYTLELKPTWAFAFHVEYAGTMKGTTQIGNLVRMICDRIHQHYA